MKKEVIILIIIMLSIPLVFAIPLINFNSPTPDKYSSFADTSWWNESWEYRQQINITNNDVTLVLTTNYTFTMNLNTSGGNFLFTGNDTRIIFYNGTDYNEIDRINTSSFNDTNTSLMFRIQENIPASSSDSNYYIYYGYSNADSPPENNSNVYLFFDDYNRANNVDITSESTYSEAGGSEWEIVNNQLKGSGGSGDPNKLMVDLFPNLDNVELQIKINVTTFAGGDSSRPGLSTRMDAGGQGYCANLHNAIGTLQFLDDARDWGSSTSVGWVLNEEYWLKFWNYEDDLKAKIWTTNTVEGSSWNLTQNSFAGHANGKVGIAMSNNADVIYYDDFSVRILVSTEPSYSFLGEESVDNLYPTFSNYWDDNATLNNSGVGGFNVTLTNTNGTVIFEINNTNITAINLSADVYNVSYYFVLNGTYSYRWFSYGNGTSELYNSSDTKYYSVNYLDTIYPIFSNYWDDNATLNNSGVGGFNVTLTNTNGTVIFEINNTNITAINLSADVYNVSYYFVLNGTYSYRWFSYGNGTSELYNSSDTKYYSVNYLAAVVSINTSSDSGGGGSSGVFRKKGESNISLSPECESNWKCGSWSFCSSNLTQRRICSDVNGCVNETSKPLEIKICPDILFDSIVELNTKKVYPWTDLSFKVNLKEINNSDLVDIKITYKIYKNQIVVYEESETRAIQGQLVFEKDINDLDLPPGDYYLSVLVEYGKDQTASAEQNFSVVGSTILIIILVIIILIILLVIISYNWYKSRKHEEVIEEKLEDIQEQLEDKKKKDSEKKGIKQWVIDKIEYARFKSEKKRKREEVVQKIEDKRMESIRKRMRKKFKDSDDLIGELK